MAYDAPQPAMTLDTAMDFIRSRSRELPPEQIEKLAKDLIARRSGVPFSSTPGGAARMLNPGMMRNIPKESVEERERLDFPRAATLGTAALSVPLAAVAGPMTYGNVLARGTPEASGWVQGQAMQGFAPWMTPVAATGGAGITTTGLGQMLARELGRDEVPPAPPFDAMAQPPKWGDEAEFAGRPAVPTPSILDGETKKQAVAANPAQPMMPPANAIGLNTDADIAEIRARVRQMEGRELPQFKTPNAEADLTERMKNIKVPTRPGLSDLSDDDKSSALLKMGLTMMGGASPFFSQNFAAGGTAGLNDAEKSRDTMMKDLMTKYGIDADMAMKLVTARSQDTAGANANIAALYNQLNDRDKNALSGMSKMLELRTAADKVKADDTYHTAHVNVLKDHYKNLADQMKGKSPAAKAEALRDELALITKLKNNTGNPQDVQLGTMMERVLHASMPAGEQKLHLPHPKIIEAEIEDVKGNPKLMAALDAWAQGEISRAEYMGVKQKHMKK